MVSWKHASESCSLRKLQAHLLKNARLLEARLLDNVLQTDLNILAAVSPFFGPGRRRASMMLSTACLLFVFGVEGRRVGCHRDEKILLVAFARVITAHHR